LKRRLAVNEASDSSGLDDKTTTYSEAIAIHRKHPVAVSAKMEASGGSEYKILNRPPIARR
jgi:hypothetical protein